MLELAELIWRKVKGDDSPSGTSRTRPTTTTSNAAYRRWTRREKILGFEATTTLDEMLDEVIPWIQQSVDEGRI